MSNITTKMTINCSLPTGWIREEKLPTRGLSTGKATVCYISPTGERIHNKSELVKCLGQKVENFDFQSGRPIRNQRNKRPSTHDAYEKKAVGIRRSALDALKKQKFVLVRHHLKSISKNSGNTQKAPPYQVLQDKRFEPYMKNYSSKNFLTNIELEDLLKKQKSTRDQEDMMMLLSQRFNHPEFSNIGPLPTNDIIEASAKLGSLKNKTSLGIIEFSDKDIKKQEDLVARFRTQLSEKYKKQNHLKMLELNKKDGKTDAAIKPKNANDN